MSSIVDSPTVRHGKMIFTGRALRQPKREKLKVGYRTHANNLRSSAAFTERDWQIVVAIYRFGLMSRDQIHREFWGPGTSHRVVSNRLATLVRHWVLNITPSATLQMSRAKMMPGHIYALGPVGEEMVAIDAGLSRGELGYNRRYASGRSQQNIMHDLMTTEVYMQLVGHSYREEAQLREECETQGLTGPDANRHIGANLLRVEWFGERQVSIWQGEKEIVRPDGMVGLQVGRTQRHYFIELDRGTTDWETKPKFYDNARQFGAWQTRLGVQEYPAVLCVVPRNRQQRIAATLRATKPMTCFFVREWDDFLADQLGGWLDINSNTEVSIRP